MTTEEAIKILDNCRIKADCARDETLPAEAEKERNDYIEACTMAIEALRKQSEPSVLPSVFIMSDAGWGI